jgi:hypothetical protein
MANLQTFDADIFALDYMWTVDDAMDALSEINRANRTDLQLTKKELLQILNDTISSNCVTKMIMAKLEDNIQDYLNYEDK